MTDGYAEVRQVFRLPKNEQAAGLIVTEGRIRNARVRLLRSGAVSTTVRYPRSRGSRTMFATWLRATSAASRWTDYNDFQEGDTLEFYR